MSNAFPLLPCPGGMDNVHPGSHQVFQVRSGQGGPQPPLRMRSIVDLDVHSDGILTARDGDAAVTTLAGGRRLFALGGMLMVQRADGLYVGGSNLCALSGSAVAAEWPIGGDQVFVSDGTTHWRIAGGAASPWGLPVPETPVGSVIGGEVPAGSYLVCATYRDGPLSDPTARESGASTPVVVKLSTPGGLTLSVGAAPYGATHAAFYVSTPNGAVPFRVGCVSAGAPVSLETLAQVRASEVPVSTLGWGPPPAGITAISSVQSFLLVAVGPYLYRSWPGRPDLFYAAQAVNVFPADITTVVGLPSGAWIGTEKGLFWLSGDNPAAWSVVRKDMAEVLPEGVALPGGIFTPLQKFSDQMVAVVATRTGLVLGLPDGNLFRMTQDQYHFPTATRVSIAYRPGALRQLLVAVT